jgi:hypothetical protein
MPRWKHKTKETVNTVPIGVNVTQAMKLVPLSRSSLYEAMKEGRLKFRYVEGVRIILYPDLVRLAAGETEAK